MKKLFVLLNLVLSVLILSGQNALVVKGKVTDVKNEAIPGVSVVVKGTLQGTITDVDGQYTISVDPKGVLVFSFVGLQTQEIPVNKQLTINVQLKEQAVNVDEVVVVGYGTQKVKDLTSSITTVKSEELAKTPAGQVMQGLQGKVAGVQVSNNGRPGSSPTVLVRGIGSYPAGNDSHQNPLNTEAPLYVVDGMFFDNIDFLNQSEIASISVLKDASAAAIYGVRAANGVILVETKSGSFNQKTEITYDGYYGTQIAQNVLKMANAEQYTRMALESESAAEISCIQNAMQRYGRSRINPDVPNVNTDWYKEIIRPAAIQNHSFNITGGNQKATYSLGSNYFEQEGILDMKNEYRRFNLRSKIDFKATGWLTIGGNVIFSNSISYGENRISSNLIGVSGGTDSAWRLAYYAIPILPVYDEQNTAAWPEHYASAQDLGYRNAQNPFQVIKYEDNRLKSKQTLMNFYVKLDIVPGKLSFKTTYNHSFSANGARSVFFPYYISSGTQRANSTLTKMYEESSDQIWDNLLTYTDKFGNHNLNVMAGTSYRDENYEMLSARGLDFPIESEQAWYLDQSEERPSGSVRDNGIRQYGISYFGRLSYNFNDKYLLYGTMRADGSSKYQQKWGYFPTVGAGWVVSEENFLKGSPIVNFLKLRGSWGRLGNDKIQASDGANTSTVNFTAINDVRTSGSYYLNTYSSLKWEVTEETNLGLTTRLFKNRLSVDADYFIRDTKNAAIRVNIPATTSTVLKNGGVIRNTGVEIALSWNDQIAKDLKYNIGVNVSTLKNRVRDLYGEPYIDGGSDEFRQRTYVGKPLLAFYGREVVGVYQNQEEIDADPIAVANHLVPGDFKYKDQNNDGALDNNNDRVILGSYFPTFLYGANLGITYKKFELSASIAGQSGNKILNRKRGELHWTTDANLDADLAVNRWHGEGTSNKYPSSSGLRRAWNLHMSDFFVEDGSFFRIQNVQLAYNIKGKHFYGLEIPSTRISLTAERPLTIFKYKGFNPEVANGIDNQTYPIPAVYTIGLNIKF